MNAFLQIKRMLGVSIGRIVSGKIELNSSQELFQNNKNDIYVLTGGRNTFQRF